MQRRQNGRPEIAIEKCGHEHAPIERRRLARAHGHDLRGRNLPSDLDRLLTSRLLAPLLGVGTLRERGARRGGNQRTTDRDKSPDTPRVHV